LGRLFFYVIMSVYFEGIKRKGKTVMDKAISGQQRFEEFVDETMREYNEDYKDLIIGMMKAQRAACSFEDKTLILEFPIQPWQVNKAGTFHGGMMCTAMDMTVAVLTRFYAGKNFTPTVSLDVKYVRPAKAGETMLVKALITSGGRRITQLTCEAYNSKTGKLLATGASVYLNVDTAEEAVKK